LILFLIGLRGAGKSTVGRLVSAQVGLEFIDLDDRTAAILGFESASEALRARGLETFRQAELAAVQSLVCEEGGKVVALGGGTPTMTAVVEVIGRLKVARVVYLRAGAQTLQARLRRDLHQRPALLGGDPVDEVPQVLGARDALYRSIADAVIETDGLDPHAVTERVVDRIPKAP
jgi:shikimate kinase